MSEIEMLTIKTKFDDSGIKDAEKRIGQMAGNAQRSVSKFNEEARIEIDTSSAEKSIDALDKKIQVLSTEREIILKKPDTKEAKKELDRLNKHLKILTQKRELKIEANQQKINEVVNSTKKLAGNLDNVAEASAKAVVGLAAGANDMKETISSLSGSVAKLAGMLGGPLAVGLATVASSILYYATAEAEAKQSSQEYGEKLKELRQYYDELARSTKDAEGRTKEFIEAQNKYAEVQTESAERTKKKAYDTLKSLKEIKAFQSEAVEAEQATVNAYNTLGKKVTSIGAKSAETKRQLQGFYKDFQLIIDSIDETGESADTAAVNLQSLAGQLEGLKEANPGVAYNKSFKALLEQVDTAVIKLGELDKATKEIASFDKFAKLSQDINDAYKRTTDGIREELQKATDGAKEFLALLDNPQYTKDKSAEEVAKLREQAKIVYEARLKDQSDFAKRLAELEAKSTDTLQQQIAKRLEALESEYAAQQEVAARSIPDAEARKESLLAVDKAYYAQREQLLLQSAQAEYAANQSVSDATIAQLKEVREAQLAFAEQPETLATLEAAHKFRLDLARKTATGEKQLEAEIVAVKKQFLQQKLDMLLKEAEASKDASEAVKSKIIADIKAIKQELADFGESSDNELAKKVSNEINTWGGYFNSLAQNMGNFFSAHYDARIQALDKSLERELRMIDNALERELAMYEEQLKAYEGLEEEKEELTKDHQERLEELNWKTQEHITEDEYRAIQDQLAEEEAKYAESMAALEADTLMRDELRLQQETAEQEALARKEELEKEYAIRRAKMERKQAESQKAAALFQAVIMTAAAIARAFADHAFPYNAVVAGIVGAAGAAQAAAIAARPLPEIPSFFKGGTIGAGNKQDYDFLPGPDNPYDNVLLWGRTGEEVLNLEESAAYRSLVASGFRLNDFEYHRMRSNMLAQQSLPSNIDNSRQVVQNVTIQAKNELTFSEARRLATKANRDLIRRLG